MLPKNLRATKEHFVNIGRNAFKRNAITLFCLLYICVCVCVYVYVRVFRYKTAFLSIRIIILTLHNVRSQLSHQLLGDGYTTLQYILFELQEKLIPVTETCDTKKKFRPKYARLYKFRREP